MTAPQRPRRRDDADVRSQGAADASRPSCVLIATNEMLAATIEARLRGQRGWRLAIGPPTRLAQLIDDYDPVVVLLSEPPHLHGHALELVRNRPQSPPVILILPDPRDAWTARARRGGVRAVLRADATAEELAAVITAVVAGLVVLHPDALRAASTVSALETTDHRELTPRELEILAMMAEGLSNHVIAGRLGISRDTVKFHVASILAKLGAASRTEAVMIAVRSGFVAL